MVVETQNQTNLQSARRTSLQDRLRGGRIDPYNFSSAEMQQLVGKMHSLSQPEVYKHRISKLAEHGARPSAALSDHAYSDPVQIRVPGQDIDLGSAEAEPVLASIEVCNGVPSLPLIRFLSQGINPEIAGDIPAQAKLTNIEQKSFAKV
ncbi:MAG: hypothetical protein HQ596_07665 [Candidatus Saganbacteria bacterium]|nr:hypothetical protein [Candidatus Saganbacteria bacterium]